MDVSLVWRVIGVLLYGLQAGWWTVEMTGLRALGLVGRASVRAAAKEGGRITIFRPGACWIFRRSSAARHFRGAVPGIRPLLAVYSDVHRVYDTSVVPPPLVVSLHPLNNDSSFPLPNETRVGPRRNAMDKIWSDVQAVAAFERSTQGRHTIYIF